MPKIGELAWWHCEWLMPDLVTESNVEILIESANEIWSDSDSDLARWQSFGRCPCVAWWHCVWQAPMFVTESVLVYLFVRLFI